MGITVELDTKMAAGFTEVTSLVLMNLTKKHTHTHEILNLWGSNNPNAEAL